MDLYFIIIWIYYHLMYRIIGVVGTNVISVSPSTIELNTPSLISSSSLSTTPEMKESFHPEEYEQYEFQFDILNDTTFLPLHYQLIVEPYSSG